MSEKITIIVDGRSIETSAKKMLLDILAENGIYVPTLCHHPSLPPNGSCRLCIVEITKIDWNGQSRLVTSCLYPAEEGLIVSTRSADVLETRRTLLELYLASCPSAEQIQNLACLEGIDRSSFAISDLDTKCIMCGLCSRVCQDCGPGAISTLRRGKDKIIGPDLSGIAEACTGCRACAYICPTGAIPFWQEEQILTIWNRQFKIPVCSVEQADCRGCGICEEVCPYSIPRVALQKGGLPVATISPTTCVGCGICAGSCPTAAIRQEQSEMLDDIPETVYKRDLKGKTVVFACSRAPFAKHQDDLIRVSCIGRIDLATILYCLAAGASGIGLMCRDRETCPYRLGGELGEKRAALAGCIASFCGLNSARIGVLRPSPGQHGPAETWEKYKEEVASLVDDSSAVFTTEDLDATGMDLALKIIGWLQDRDEFDTCIPDEISSLFKNTGSANLEKKILNEFTALHFLFKLLMDEPIISNLLKELDAKKELDRLQLPTAGKDSFTFKINHQRRRELIDRHCQGADGFYCRNVAEYIQYALLLRPGSWRFSNKSRPTLTKHAPADSSALEGATALPVYRVTNHPILAPLPPGETEFVYNGRVLQAREGEVISSALYAAGIHIFGHHERDGGAQGIYCVNGQCSQCMVIADGKPVKGCMTPIFAGMVVESVEGLPLLADMPPEEAVFPAQDQFETDVLIIGGGPAGISAAIELGSAGIKVLIIDDKHELGGKLGLQTHNFFGSVRDCYAGERGIHIGRILTNKLKNLPAVEVWLDSTVVGVFSDGLFGVAGHGSFKLVKARCVLFSTGAREKSLALPGADLPGVYGAGAFQTLVNRDLVRCAERLFIVGGGNVGLIGAYHALQAGIDVVGLVEALPSCGGYKVHEDKIKRFGVPVWTSHTVLRIEGKEEVERVIVAAIDEKFQPIPGTERSFEVDTVLIAVGLSPVDELLQKASEYGIKTYAAGDAEEIAEASAAIFSGKIVGRKIAQEMGIDLPVPGDWEEFGAILKHRPGESAPFIARDHGSAVYPLIRCMQEIPCDPCTETCPNNCISIPGSILSLPEFNGECIGCGQCVLACPGLAINLVVNDYDADRKNALLMMPYEFVNETIPLGKEVTTTDMEGNVIGKGRVIAYRDRVIQNSRRLLLLEVPYKDRLAVAAFMIREIDYGTPLELYNPEIPDPIVCRCERVKKSEILDAIRSGVRDMNQLKAVIRIGLGGCNGKTCTDLILKIYREEGIPLSEITLPTHRPLVAEVHLGDFVVAGTKGENCDCQ